MQTNKDCLIQINIRIIVVIFVCLTNVVNAQIKTFLVESEFDTTLNGMVKKYYDNGNIKSQLNYYNGKLQGVSKYYYFNGEVEKEASFEHNKMNGRCTYWDECGNLIVEFTMENDSLVGDIIFLSTRGKICKKPAKSKSALRNIKRTINLKCHLDRSLPNPQVDPK